MTKKEQQKGVIFACNVEDEAFDIDVKPGIKNVCIWCNLTVDRNSKKSFPDVENLYIAENVSEINIPNTLFPNVKLVGSASEHFWTDRYLVKICNGYKKLCNVFCGPETELDLNDIHYIADYALAESNISTLKNATKTLFSCDKYAFTNSVFDKQPFVNGVKMAGDILIAIDKNADTIILPDEEVNPLHMCVDGIHLSKVRHMVIHSCFSLTNYKITEMPMSVTLDLECQPGDLEDLIERFIHTIKNGSYIHDIHLTDKVHGYKEMDGMIYSDDMSVLVACPIDKEEVIIPEGVKTIEPYAFRSTHVKYIKFPDSLEQLRRYAISGCEKLTKFDFGNGLYCIGDYAFENCFNLEHIKLPHQMRRIGRYAFKNSGLKSIEINPELKIIQYGAFCKTHVTELDLPDSFEKLEGLEEVPELKCIRIKTYVKDIEKSISRAVVDSPTLLCLDEEDVIKLKCADKIIFVPRCIKSRVYFEICNKIKTFLQSDSEETLSLYSYAATIHGREMTAMMEYMEFADNSKQKRYLKRHAEQISSRLMTEDEEKEIEFLKLGLNSKKSLKELLKIANYLDLSTIASYILEELNNTKTQTEDFNL